MGLRDLIEAKQRRTATWPLLVGNPSAAAAAVETARKALAVHEAGVEGKKAQSKKPTAADRKRGEQLRDALKAAVEDYLALTVEVELQALPDDEWESLFGPLEPDESGDLDITSILAPLLGASCTDPELQDADWWAAQLARPEWTDGDKATLSRTLLELNVYAPQFAALGKG